MCKLLAVLLSLILLVTVGAGQEKVVRQPAVAGGSYPATVPELTAKIQSFLRQATPIGITGEILGMVSPHASYEYSGVIAAQGYRQLIGRQYETVIVISPSHHEYFSYSSVMESGAYKTPLGEIAIDQDLSKKIAAGRKTIKLSDKGHLSSVLVQPEHALEVQLPFLQQVLDKFRLVAIVMGDQSYANCEELATAIAQAVGKHKVLIVASSDLSHYHPDAEAKRLDQRCASLIEKYDFDALYNQLETRQIEACGGGPIIAMLMATKKLGANQVKILKCANSGDTAGNRSSVVGYLSAVIIKSGANKIPATEKKLDDYSSGERNELLKIARTTIENCVQKQPVPEFTVQSARLKEKRGAFVTINENGELRGCIGYILPVMPLYQTVRQVAEAAALEDPRFPPVQPDELKNLHLEISVLTVPQRITDINQIEVGKHGLIIKNGFNQGLLLPQVATEYGWDRITFLEQTCRKAGLHKDTWKNPETEIQIFSAIVFGE